MKISYISKTNSWNDEQIVKEARKLKIDCVKKDLRDLNDPKIYKSLGDIILWRSSSLEPRVGRTTLLNILIKQGKTVINRSIVDYPAVIFKQFQQEYVRKFNKKINTIQTFTFFNKDDLIKGVREGLLEFPFIKKPNLGSKGQGIKLVLDKYGIDGLGEDEVKQSVFQNFIENDGDYRVLVIGGRPIGAMKRVGKKNSFVNNVSMGGETFRVDNEKLESKLFEIAAQVAATFNLGFCGVDIIKNKRTGELFFLELNTVPQWEGFQKCTKVNVARELLLYCQELHNRNIMPTRQLVAQCYSEHSDKLANKKFHFFTRMFLWTKDKKYLEKLNSIKHKYYGNNEEELLKILKSILKKKSVYQKRIYNKKDFRKKTADKYPLLGAYSEILFRNLMSKNVFNYDLRPVIKKLISDEELLKLKKELLSNKKDMLSLSTFSANFLYFMEDYMSEEKGDDDVDIMRILDVVEREVANKKENDIELVRNSLYFITHLIIGESRFYKRDIIKNRDVYQKLLLIAEKIIGDNYLKLSLDIKMELLVCAKLVKAKSSLENIINQEAEMSLSEINNFLVDRMNGRCDLSPKGFLGSEHRNVLYIMANL